MKKNNFTFGGGRYSAPEIELYSAQVENGFQGSVTPITVDVDGAGYDDWGTLE
ncbi:MAG: hypothetical protein IKD41_03245 [Alistipes sp.]|nr:hypothetical protein [Alistipes sp.]